MTALGQLLVFGLQGILDHDGAGDGIEGAVEFSQNVVAGGIDDTPPLLVDQGCVRRYLKPGIVLPCQFSMAIRLLAAHSEIASRRHCFCKPGP